MAINFSIPAYFGYMLSITRLKSFIPKSLFPDDDITAVAANLRHDSAALNSAATDFGHMVTDPPAAVLFPSSMNDIISLIKLANSLPVPFNIAAKGCGHSVRGQAMARNGVVVEMASLNNPTRISVSGNASDGFFADVGGEQMWIDVLNATLKHGLAPTSWTDYLYLTVGGTLSNAGISGQTFRYGPQISNVVELDVITGKGDLVSCSAERNWELFHSVLGGLGQFGIIIRARIPLFPAPNRVKWVRMLYTNFSEFTEDQERLISINGSKQNGALDYLEGLLLMHDGPPDNWRSSFFPPSHHSTIISLVNQHSIIYCLEVAKYYDHTSRHTLDKELDDSLNGLRFLSGYKFEKDVSYVEFLNRVRSGELSLKSQGLWDVPHPWLNLFVPKSRIAEFNSGVFKDIVLKQKMNNGPILVYPMNRSKWDDRMTAVIPDEEVFYTIGFLNSSGFDNWEAMDEVNKEILRFCNSVDMKIKQYLPHYRTQADWANHFGHKWNRIQDTKKQFDPNMILSPGHKIFNS
ncbi:cytokinin dehydrogenase 3-like [Cucurbita pepo subsp. pepo]|uniref:cytokinin dehydrogenase 3-like n=1 Tax=Cucurbita pepo subsp. pepo TaxID=3664 RepID=UPI000C9DA5DE|nr:cytokinin dehydrogenase 3-like [Cucurbita pepo subsp. pepo]